MSEDDGKEEGLKILSKGDVEAIASALETRLMKKFYTDLGRGVWGIAWKAVILFIIFVAAQGDGGWRFWGK